jgi:hypothetical protein
MNSAAAGNIRNKINMAASHTVLYFTVCQSHFVDGQHSYRIIFDNKEMTLLMYVVELMLICMLAMYFFPRTCCSTAKVT